MKRRNFMAMLGKGAGALALAPLCLREIPGFPIQENTQNTQEWEIGTWEFTTRYDSIQDAIDAAPGILKGVYHIHCHNNGVYDIKYTIKDTVHPHIYLDGDWPGPGKKMGSWVLAGVDE